MKFRIGVMVMVFLVAVLLAPSPTSLTATCEKPIAVEGDPVNPQPTWKQQAGTVRIGLVWALNGPVRKVFLRGEDNVTFQRLGGKMFHFSPECEKEARRDFDEMRGNPPNELKEVTLRQLQEEGFVLKYARH